MTFEEIMAAKRAAKKSSEAAPAAGGKRPAPADEFADAKRVKAADGPASTMAAEAVAKPAPAAPIRGKEGGPNKI